MSERGQIVAVAAGVLAVCAAIVVFAVTIQRVFLQDSGTTGVKVSILNVTQGDCFNLVDGDDELRFADIVGCDEPHQIEAYAGFWHPATLGDPDIAGTDASEWAYEQCREAFKSFVGVSPKDSETQFAAFYPNTTRWENERGSMLCTLYQKDHSGNLVYVERSAKDSEQ